ncbi:hypothetical protein K493DRAFT_319524 [Basidiobolus meristosporus CBS 931.73]|uniref:Uncharacterized protein n=1 Tax=Basidiobolus meristosporus CBS 931.73 TaxID=1314790 RepID=A0A1Y1XRI3_9FUNG|nr:hypothetical protein K493DRAFT_319524 [Basidiobolus meristosporus CBS 931.73]|eukprot:ORX88368.1 hypothetical protein K493DRAFT_319524 [Basidiobolus meristosporus CBS 931.73]
MILSIIYILWVTLWTYQTTSSERINEVKPDLPPIQYLSNNSSDISPTEPLPHCIWDQVPTGDRIRSALRRITIYPLACAVLQAIFVTFGVLSMLDWSRYSARLMLVVLTAIHGIVHSVTFVWDPTVQVCLNTLSTDLLEQYQSHPRQGVRSRLIYYFCKLLSAVDQTKSLQQQLSSQSRADLQARQTRPETIFANSKFDLTLKTPTRAHFFNPSEASLDQLLTRSPERNAHVEYI